LIIDLCLLGDGPDMTVVVDDLVKVIYVVLSLGIEVR